MENKSDKNEMSSSGEKTKKTVQVESKSDENGRKKTTKGKKNQEVGSSENEWKRLVCNC